MKKKIVTMLTCFVMCSVFLFSGFVSFASVLSFDVPYSQPPTSDTQGYITILKKTPDNRYFINTFFWNISAFSGENYLSSGNSVMDVILDFEKNSVSFYPTVDSDTEACWNLGVIWESNFVGTLASGYFNTQTSQVYNSSDDIVGVVGYGNVRIRNVPNNFEIPFVVNYGSDTLIIDYLQRIDDVLENMKIQLDSVEQGKIDNFESSSSSQTNELTSLNQQNQVDKVDVDSVSQQVDSVLDMETDANYGVLLSTFTSNGRVLTMMLLCVSVALISFVLFGKRD